MRPILVIVASPALDFVPSIDDVEEYFPIQTFIPQSAVEAFDVAVLNRPAWPDEVHLYSGLIGPCFHRPASEFAAIIRGNGFRRSAQCDQPSHLLHHFLSRLGAIRKSTQAFPGVLIHHRQNTKPAPICQPVAHEIHAPPLVRTSGSGQLNAYLHRAFRSFLGSHLQLLRSIESIHSLHVHYPPFSPQQHCQPPIAVPSSATGQLSQPHPQFSLGVPTALIAIDPARNSE